MGGLIMEFSQVLTSSGTTTFNLPESFNTASVCPVPGSSGAYTIQPLLDGVIYGTASPAISDVTSFPEGTRTWSAHRIICTAGSVIVKYQSKSIVSPSS